MATSSLHILLPFLLLLLQATTNLAAADADVIDQICHKTPFFDLCSATLHSNPLSPNSDLKAIAAVMLADILRNATDTLSFIESLIKHTSDHQLEQSLAFCAESYIPIVKYTLPQAADALAQGRFAFAAYCVGDAQNQIQSCDKRFSDLDSSPMGDRNDVVQRLVGVASAIIREYYDSVSTSNLRGRILNHKF
ncbi:Cell wall / vacuolar inhibitor of fructosidase 1 [Senna tora]|uniref:Cell wall / vacuolar inhibitor of fructosidase 1 n=1 Tax=Senna tora TaxID=362788 RepID=A0A834SPY3_9FABA|nr:Cell wall / vacuolar inhibitor of fructosidase 1 [Senna tora]